MGVGLHVVLFPHCDMHHEGTKLVGYDYLRYTLLGSLNPTLFHSTEQLAAVGQLHDALGAGPPCIRHLL